MNKDKVSNSRSSSTKTCEAEFVIVTESNWPAQYFCYSILSNKSTKRLGRFEESQLEQLRGLRIMQLQQMAGGFYSSDQSHNLLQMLTFRHRASCILGQAFHYSPENAFYILNQQIYFIIWYLLDRASLI